MSFEEATPLTTKTNTDNYNLSSKMSENKDINANKQRKKELKKKSNPKFKSKKNKYGTTLRQIQALLREVDIIEEACAGKRSKKQEQILDPFQNSKKELNDKLKDIKSAVKTQKNIQARVGKGPEAIKLKNQIKHDLEVAKQLHAEMEEAYKDDKYKVDNDVDGCIDGKELKNRKELLELMKQDMDYTEHGYQPKNEQGRGYSLARETRNRRKKQRDEGKIGMDPVPLTDQQQAFIQMSIERDAIIDKKLDIILDGVKQVNQIGLDVNQELKKQDLILDEIDEKMDKVTEKLEKRNEQMKKLLEASGGLQRWCPLIILLVILLAVIGWIWNSLSKK